MWVYWDENPLCCGELKSTEVLVEYSVCPWRCLSLAIIRNNLSACLSTLLGGAWTSKTLLGI